MNVDDFDDADGDWRNDDDDFEYEQFVQREFGDGGRASTPAWIQIAAVILMALMLLGIVATAS